MTLQLRRSAWTVGETAAHLVIALRGFTDAAHDDLRRWEDRLPDVALRYRERLADFNATTISAEPTRDARGAGQAIVDAAEAFLEATAELPAGRTVPTPWYAEGTGLTVAAATRLLLGEQVIHGHDIAKAAGRKWMIDTADAELIFGRFAPCCPSLPTRMLSAASQPASTSGSGISPRSPFASATVVYGSILPLTAMSTAISWLRPWPCSWWAMDERASGAPSPVAKCSPGAANRG